MNIGEYCPEQYIILHEIASAIFLRVTIFTNIHEITLLLYSNKYVMPKAFFYINIVYFIIFK
jgi:hypothetical protein